MNIRQNTEILFDKISNKTYFNVFFFSYYNDNTSLFYFLDSL